MSQPFNYIVDHIPTNTPKNRRPRTYMKPEYITIHNTANPKSTAKNERAWLTNVSNQVTASYHLVVDEKEVIECIPFNEVAWHAGDGNGKGNRTSIGIELCESGNQETVLKNAVFLVVDLLEKFNLTVDKIKQHYDWSGKNCPRLLRANNNKLWNVFIQGVKEEIEKRKVAVAMSKYFNDVPASHWGVKHVDSLYEKGITSGKENGVFDPDSPITRIEVATLIDRAIEYIIKNK